MPPEENSFCVKINDWFTDFLDLYSLRLLACERPTWPPHSITRLRDTSGNTYRNDFADEESATCILTAITISSSLALLKQTSAKCPSAAFEVPSQRGLPDIVWPSYKNAHSKAYTLLKIDNYKSTALTMVSTYEPTAIRGGNCLPASKLWRVFHFHLNFAHFTSFIQDSQQMDKQFLQY